MNLYEKKFYLPSLIKKNEPVVEFSESINTTYDNTIIHDTNIDR